MIMSSHGKPRPDCADEPSVVEVAHQRLRSSPFAALHEVKCTFDGEILCLVGEVPNFYTKQLAQTLVRDIEKVSRIENRLLVRW